MDPLIIVLVVLLVLDVCSLREVYRLWRGEATEFDNGPPRYWPWGDAAWRAWRRQQPLCVTGTIPITCGFIVLFAAGGASTAGGIAFGVVAVCFVVFFGLALINALLNQPKLVAPPHLRADVGLIKDLARDR